MTNNHLNPFRSLLKEILGLAPFQFFALLLLSTLVAITEGLGLLSLIPILHNFLGAKGFAVPEVSSEILNRAIQSLKTDLSLEVILANYLLLLLFLTLLSWARIRLAASLQARYMLNKRKQLFESVIYSDLATFSKLHSGRIINALGEQLDKATTTIFIFLDLLASLILSAIFLITACYASPQITLIALCFSLFAAFCLRKLVGRNARLGLSITQETGTYFQTISDLVHNFRRIRSSGAEEQASEMAEKSSLSLAHWLVQAAKNQALLHLATTMSAGIILALVSWAILSYTTISWAAAGASTLLLARILAKASGIQRNLQYLLELLPCFGETFVLQASLGEAVKPPSTDNSKVQFRTLEFEDLEFCWPENPSFSLPPINLSLKPGQLTALIGASGAGKSTLADIVAGIVEPEAGSIVLDGKALSNFSKLRKLVAYVPQQACLLSGSFRENLCLGSKEVSEDCLNSVLNITQLKERIIDLDAKAGEAGIGLSGGEQQRLLIAQALVLGRPLLILDEATSGLDPALEKNLINSIRQNFPELAILAISHKNSVAELADKVIKLK